MAQAPGRSAILHAVSLHAWGSPSAWFEGCTFDANTASSGGALELNAVGSSSTISATLVDSTVTSNTGALAGYKGTANSSQWTRIPPIGAPWQAYRFQPVSGQLNKFFVDAPNKVQDYFQIETFAGEVEAYTDRKLLIYASRPPKK